MSKTVRKKSKSITKCPKMPKNVKKCQKKCQKYKTVKMELTEQNKFKEEEEGEE